MIYMLYLIIALLIFIVALLMIKLYCIKYRLNEFLHVLNNKLQVINSYQDKYGTETFYSGDDFNNDLDDIVDCVEVIKENEKLLRECKL